VSVASTSVAAAQSAGRTVDRLLERPRAVLGTLVAAQIAGTVVLALSATHNGWVYFQGGDQIVNTTTGWLLGRLQIPPTEVSYAWPLVQAPITWFTGPTFVQALPAIVLLNVLVLGPIALLCVYEIAAHVGGRLLGYWAATLWVIAPFAVIPLFVDRYHEKWVDQFLPQALGLTAMPDFPSMVAVLAAAVFVVRSLSAGRLHDAVLAGLLAGAAGGLKPPNYLFAVGAVLAYLVARRWREGTAFAVALVPSILVLALWKERGLGYIPALTLEQARLAAGSGALALDVNLDRYIDLDLEHWRQQMDQLREFFWSARLAQWAPFAGLLAVLRVRRFPIAALLAGWLGAFLLVKGFSPRASIEANTFWRLLMPAWPAYLLLFASIPLLVPTLARRLDDRVRPRPSRAEPVERRWVVVAAVVAVGIPLVVTAASDRIEPPTPAIVQTTESDTTILTPVDDGIELRVERDGSSRRLTWTRGSWRAGVFYRVYRTNGPGGDTQCALSEGVSWSCYLLSTPISTTREPVYVDTSPPAGATYRIGVGTNWIDDPEQGDVFDFSPPARTGR
jgi:hypothetical protein